MSIKTSALRTGDTVRGTGPIISRKRSSVPSRRRWSGWLFVLPALVPYTLFVLQPLLTSLQYSFYDWNGIGVATWVGLENYATIFTHTDQLLPILHAFELIIFFTIIPVTLGLIAASLLHGLTQGPFMTTTRVILFLPQVIPLVAAGIAWKWAYSETGWVNQFLEAIGLGGITRAWLADFTWALPAVGLIGSWVMFGLCTLLLTTGISKIDVSLYEAARIDGAGRIREFMSVTLPGLRKEIGVCVTVTVIAALASFDVVYITTGGGPGRETLVPGVQIFRLAFSERDIGMASAAAVVLMALVLLIVVPLQRFFNKEES